jgi:hypothetical protein
VISEGSLKAEPRGCGLLMVPSLFFRVFLLPFLTPYSTPGKFQYNSSSQISTIKKFSRGGNSMSVGKNFANSLSKMSEYPSLFVLGINIRS